MIHAWRAMNRQQSNTGFGQIYRLSASGLMAPNITTIDWVPLTDSCVKAG